MQPNPSTESAPSEKSRLRRWGRPLLFIFVCFVTLVALYHAEENWRGKRAWDQYQRELAAQGKKFDPTSFIPPKVADEENFAMTPFLAPLFDFLPGTQKHRDTNGENRVYAWGKLPDHNNTIPWQVGRATDLDEWVKSWQRMMAKNKQTNTALPANLDLTNRRQAAQAILLLLKEDEAVIEEFRAASRRPYARFNIAYDNPDKFSIILPHLSQLKKTCQILELRSSAELALGETDQAFQDTELIFHLANTVKDEPILVSHLVRIVMLHLALQPIWEGLGEHRWSEPQLRQFEKQIEEIDMIKSYAFSTRAERDFLGDSLFDEFRAARSRLGMLNGLSDVSGIRFGNRPNWLLECGFRIAVPTGWSYFEQINYKRLATKQQLSAVDVAARRINPSAMEANWKEVQKILSGGGESNIGRDRTSPDNLAGFSLSSMANRVLHHLFMARLLTPALGNITKKTAVSQSCLDMAGLACALERYYLAEHQYPASLETLVPKFVAQVPHDVISGQALKYRTTDDGRFVLYSVGWNEKDDGGTVALEKKNKSGNQNDYFLARIGPDILEGDWVWQYAAATGK